MSSTIEVQSSPTQDKFFLRTILPISQRDYIGNRRTGEWKPKYDWFINQTPCQVEIVTRRANGSPDTIELISEVDVADEYKITHNEHQNTTSLNWLPNMAPILVRCRLNNRTFETTFVDQNLEIMRAGENCITIRLFDTLKDNNGEELFGIHLYITQYKNQESYELDIRVTNGNIENPIGGVYFHSLQLLCGSQYTLVPRKGSERFNSYDNYIVQPGQWFFPKQGQFHRRFIVASPDLAVNPEELDYLANYSNLGFVTDGPRSWHTINAFGPTKVLFGKYTDSYRTDDSHWFRGKDLAAFEHGVDANNIRDALRSGKSNSSVNIHTDAFGPFHPYFNYHQGTHGGDEINHTHGYSLSNFEYIKNIMIHAATCERQPWVQYKPNGLPKTAEEFAEPTGEVPFVYATRDPYVNALPMFRNIEDYNTGEVTREIENWLPHDSSHQVRYNKRCQALVYLGNDALAKDDMLMSATLNMLELHTLEHKSNNWAFSWSLKEKRDFARANMKQGNTTGRHTAWQIDSIVSYYTVAYDEWRTQNFDWFKQCAEMLLWSTMPTGWVSRKSHWSQVTSESGLGHDIDAAQCFELEFEDWSKYALATSIFEGTEYGRYYRFLSFSILRSAKTLFEKVYNGKGFPWYVSVGDKDGRAFKPNQISSNGGNEISYAWFIMLFAYYTAKKMDDNNAERWLEYFKEFKEASPSNEDKIDKLMQWASQNSNNLPASMPIIGELQK